jgi:hypothetical protein
MLGLMKYIGLIFTLLISLQLQAIAKDKKETPLDLPTITTNPVVTSICAGSKLNVSFTVSNDFDPGNIFSVELSDANGNFTTPTVIGTLNSVTSGAILASLPKNLQEGHAYRVRVVGSLPPVTGTDNGTNITIYELPVLNIEGNLEPCSNQSYAYSTNSELGFTYQWIANGGQIQGNSTATTVYVIWGTDTSGTLQLIKRNGITACADTMTVDISVKFAPEAKISSGKYEVCADEIVEYIPAPGSVAASDWLCQGGTILYSDASVARVKWNYAGSGWIELQKTNEYGCTAKERKTVIVHATPIAQIIGSSNAFSGKKMLYKSIFETGTACRWQVSGGTMQDSTRDSVYVTWGQPGNGQLRLIKYYLTTDCSDTAKLDVTINPSLPAGNIKGKENVCSGATETYSTDTVSNTYIRWFVAGGNIIGADNGFSINVKWGVAGSGEVKYIITEFGSGNRDSVELAVTINPIPEIVFPELGEICENDKPLSLNMAEPDGGAYVGTGVDMGYFYPDRAGVGSHEITYSYTNDFGCEAKKTRTIIVNPKPAKPIISVIDSGLSSNYDYGNQWYASGNAIEGANGKVLFPPFESEVYTVQFTDSNGCKSDMSDPIEVPVEEYITDERVVIYPNPAGDFLIIKNETEQIIEKIVISDMLGYEIMSLNHWKTNVENIQRLEISKIPNGFYVIKFYISNLIIAEKLIISR